jgi:hypothetical protein
VDIFTAFWVNAGDATTSVDNFFADGAWVNADSIPLLNPASASNQILSLDEYYTGLVLASTINALWIEQNMFIMCYDMSQDDCKYYILSAKQYV